VLLLTALSLFGAVPLPKYSAEAYAEGERRSFWIYLDAASEAEDLLEKLPGTVRLRYRSSALSAFSADCPAAKADVLMRGLRNMSGVEAVHPMGLLEFPEPELVESDRLERSSYSGEYGESYLQLAMLGIPELHALGYHGQGVSIGILDQGFDREMEALRHVMDEGRLLAEYDFVYGDSLTRDEDDEGTYGLAMKHGNGVWSVIAGNLPGQLIGGARKADFILAKTEDVRWERRIEEDNFVAAVEWMVDLGVDIISVSLNYLEFDAGEESYSFADMDGKTTAVTRIINWAAEQGAIPVVAMGNYQESLGESSTIWGPADSPEAVTVGAVNDFGGKAYFSRMGPTADGRIKPDIMALGEPVVMVDESGSATRSANGTSFATPLISSGIAILKQIHPDWSRKEIMEAFRTFSTRPVKDNSFGWGVPDFYRIVTESPVPVLSRVQAYPNPASGILSLKWSGSGPGKQDILVFNILGQRVERRQAFSLDALFVHALDVSAYPAGIYFAQLGAESVKFVKLP